MVGDIDQPQCHTCTTKQKNILKEKKKDTCDIVVGQCHNVTNHNVTHVLPEDDVVRLLLDER